MKVCLCQMNITWEDKESNQIKATEFIQMASKEKAELVLFPEMCLTGFSMNIQKTMESQHETMEFFRNLAIQYHMYLGFGWTKTGSNENKAENHFTLIIPSGEVVIDYIKIHPFSYAKEDCYFDSGQEIMQYQLGEFNLSAFICYDLRFPEMFQVASQKSHIIIVAANWPEKRKEHWKCLLKARAIENQVYILGVNCVGEIGGQNYSGDSCIIDPSGITLAELSNKEGIVSFDITDNGMDYRQEFPVKGDRKPQLYYSFYDNYSDGEEYQ